jgi:hypothetical protein
MCCFGPLSLIFPLHPLFQTPSYGPDDDDDDYYYHTCKITWNDKQYFCDINSILHCVYVKIVDK